MILSKKCRMLRAITFILLGGFMMKFYAIILGCAVYACFLAVDNVYAVPSVANVSGVLAQGNTLSIVGSDMGSKSVGTPLRYDDFENGTIGEGVANNPTGGGWNTNLTNFPKYSNTEIRYSGRQSIKQEYITNEGCVLSLDNSKNVGTIPSGTKELYVSGWFWMETWDSDSRNVKIINMGYDLTPNSGGWQTRIDVYPSNGSGHLYANLSDDSTAKGTDGDYDYVHDYDVMVANTLLPDKKWHRIESYLRVGKNGFRDVWIDGVKIGEITGSFTDDSTDLGYLLIGHFFAIDTYTPSPKGRRYWDEIYVDTTRARIEIGDSNDFYSCTHREIQLPTAWDSEQIQITVNQGSMDTLSDKYLFVVDADGNVSVGFSLANMRATVGPASPKEFIVE